MICTRAEKNYEMQEEEAKQKRKLHSGTKLLLTGLKKEHLFTLEYYCCFVPLCLCVCVLCMACKL